MPYHAPSRVLAMAVNARMEDGEGAHRPPRPRGFPPLDFEAVTPAQWGGGSRRKRRPSARETAHAGGADRRHRARPPRWQRIGRTPRHSQTPRRGAAPRNRSAPATADGRSPSSTSVRHSGSSPRGFARGSPGRPATSRYALRPTAASAPTCPAGGRTPRPLTASVATGETRPHEDTPGHATRRCARRRAPPSARTERT